MGWAPAGEGQPEEAYDLYQRALTLDEKVIGGSNRFALAAYSVRNAVTGSTSTARRAGNQHAANANNPIIPIAIA